MAGLSRSSLALAAGIALDVAVVDPPNAIHPVAWIGRAVRLLERAAPMAPGDRRRFGLFVALAVPLATLEAARRVQRLRPRWLSAAVLLALASSHRTLFTRVSEVRDALDAGDLEGARTLLGHHLVSRDTSQLDASEVSGAAIESLAENLSDGVIAPWLWFAVGGAPVAWAYRASNTLDALWGYRDERYEDLGKAAAHLDDAWNLVPARLTALTIAAASFAESGSLEAVRVWRRDARQTASPNAGHPMAAIAGVIGVRLGKRGEYDLNAGARSPGTADITAALRVARLASAFAGGLLLAGTVAGRRR